MSNQTTALRLRDRMVWMTVAALLVASFLPFLTSSHIVSAAEVQNRSITISSSESGATDVEYAVSFDTATAGNVEALVLQYCGTSPIIGDVSCSDTRSFDWVDASLTVNSQVGITDWAVDAANSSSTKLILSRTGGPADPGASTTISFTLGSSSTDGVTNPITDNSAFYVRALTYATDAGAIAYTPGTPGTHVDDGGIALSTAELIDIAARVQERLTFCVGTTDPGAACAGISGNSVDLGVLSSSINLASTESTPIYAQVSTNANSGVSVQYIADHLDVSACVDADADKQTNDTKTDQCLNHEADGVTNTIAGGDEQWGIGITAHPEDGTETTDALTPVTAYDSNGTTEFSFAPNVATQIASSTGVVDSEQLTIDVAATSSLTTPTGLYTTTMTFIATSTF